MQELKANLIDYEGIAKNVVPAKYTKVISLSDGINIDLAKEIIILKAKFKSQLIDYRLINDSEDKAFIFHIKTKAEISYIEKDGPSYLMTANKEWLHSSIMKIKTNENEAAALNPTVYNSKAFVTSFNNTLCISLNVAMTLGGLAYDN